MKVIVFGGTGLVGSRFISLKKKDFEILAPETSEVNILNKDQIKNYFEKNEGSVINFSAFTRVEEAENQKDKKEDICYQINAMGAKNVADVCGEYDKHLIHISTDYVFDGTKDTSPYVEEDQPNPINWYGETKYLGEQFVLGADCKSTVVRISMPYSHFYEAKKDIARFFLEQLKHKKKVAAVDGQRITPTLVDDIVEALGLVLENRSLGIYHVSSTDNVTPFEFAKTIAKTFNLNYQLIESINFEEFNKNKKAKILKYSWLNPTKFERKFGEGVLHTVEEALQLFKNNL